ncbi:protein kinase [Planctomonas sp. JC2975]|uniref:serine/threonine-protein kinase n=1 Tax=Planctomonas sp. JC2975 TaxID=2729626 RepID=UPI001472BA69|nr:protein kinase [Planctomonas sp. JC2975]NNC11016.1 protein kinase [Planctomonas sp. JC2975]
MSRRVAAEAPELPGYAYQRLLGSGGFSDVFLYEQKLPRRKVAVKVLLTDELDQQSRAHFVAEANVMAQLSAHPYIVTIYHADVSADDRPYFVMEYCSGPSLGERYKRERFGVEDALRIGVRVSSAVATAHAAGILHRDIKPANVLTNDFGWPALTDFGISSTLEDELPTHTTTLSRLPNRQGADTTTRQSVGLSVPWSPAEMFDDDPKPDVRSDVFSLAATIYTLLAGHTPFEVPGRSNGTLDLIGRIERGAITPLDRPDVPRTLVAVLAKGMATRRDDRYASAVEFARALQRVELELGYSPTGIEVPNLAVAVERAESEVGVDPADETRIRQVSTIIAQPAAPRPVQPRAPQPPPPSPMRIPAGPDADATRVRDVQTVRAQPAADQTIMRGAAASAPDHTMLRHAPTVAAPGMPVPAPVAEPAAPETDTPETAAPNRRRIGMIVGIVAACVVIVVGGITAATLLVPGTSSATHTNAPGSDDGQIALSSVPDPTLVSKTRSADGTSVTFVWKNPKPKPQDSYQWLRDSSTDSPTSTDKPQATLTGLTPGASVCIQVEIVRDGRTSPNGLKACSP